MDRPFIVGPVTSTWIQTFARDLHASGTCRGFNYPPNADHVLRPQDGWETFAAQFPQQCQPQFALINMPQTALPTWFWKAPLPLVVLIDNWQLHWHASRRLLRWCDLVFTDAEGVNALHRAGIDQARAGTLTFLDAAHNPQSAARDIDILVLNNPGPVSPQAGRLLDRLTPSAKRWRIAVPDIKTASECRAWLDRAKIVLDSRQGSRMSSEQLTAIAAGALLFRESTGPGASATDEDLGIRFNDETLPALLERYLTDADARHLQILAARERLSHWDNQAQLRRLLEVIESEWDLLLHRAAARSSSSSMPDLQTRCWQALQSGGLYADPALVSDVFQSSSALDSAQQNMLGVVLAHDQQADGPVTDQIAGFAVEHFRGAVAGDADNVLAGLNLVEACIGVADSNPAIEAAKRTLTRLEANPDLDRTLLDGPHFPPVPDVFWREWERAGWLNAGDPAAETEDKRRLLCWRLHLLLAELTDDIGHYYEAVLARPDLAGSRAALGCALGRAGRPAEAVRHLRFAVENDPLDVQAARALLHGLGELGSDVARLRLVERRLALRDMAPDFVPHEEWLVPATPVEEQLPVEVVAPPPTKGSRVQRVSLCMIVKNEEANLPECLQSAADLVDEIIVVDTGSTDSTKAVAARFQARIVDFPWIDDFAAARNESIRHAQGDWILWLDADDRLDDDNRQKLRTLLHNLKDENAAYVMKCLCLPDQATGTATVVDHVRLFRNLPELRWRYRVHEQILLALREHQADVRWSDVVIHHCGYQESQHRSKKLERDLRLLMLQNTERPDDPFTLFNLGWSYNELGRHREALPYLERSLGKSAVGDSIVRKLYALIVFCHRQLGDVRQAMLMCQDGLRYCPSDTELLFEYGVLLQQCGNLPAAEACFLQLLGQPSQDHFASIDPALRGYRARHQLALIYDQQERDQEADKQWRLCLQERVDFRPALFGRLELALRHQVWGEFDDLLQALESLSNNDLEASVLRARRFMAEKDFSPAKQLLTSCCERAPTAIWPRLVLSHALLQEDKDHTAAEQALREVLKLDPNHAQTLHNLRVLLAGKHQADRS